MYTPGTGKKRKTAMIRLHVVVYLPTTLSFFYPTLLPLITENLRLYPQIRLIDFYISPISTQSLIEHRPCALERKLNLAKWGNVIKTTYISTCPHQHAQILAKFHVIRLLAYHACLKSYIVCKEVTSAERAVLR